MHEMHNIRFVNKSSFAPQRSLLKTASLTSTAPGLISRTAFYAPPKMKMQLLASQDQYTHTEAARDRHRGFRDSLYQKGLSPSRTPYSVAS
jgi:hypothetical protein